ncbi:MAG: BT4734/BF3469 family protein [Verrucomicrobiota bacterium]
MHSPIFDFYPHAEAWKPAAETTLVDLIDAIRGEEFAPAVSEIRALLAAGDKDAASAAKKKLPAVSLSGAVTGRRAKAVAEDRFAHSGLLQIDLDAKDNPGWTVAQMREVLKNGPHIIAGFVSASGNGVKGIARIPADSETHLACFLAAEAHFQSLGLTIDKSCKDPVRLCFISHDPNAWLRVGEVEEFSPLAETLPEPNGDDMFSAPVHDDDAPAEMTTRSASGGLIIRGGYPPIDAALVREMLKAIPPRPDYHEWLKIASAVWDALGENDGTAALNEWSVEEKPGEYAAKHKSRLKDVRSGTLIMRAKEHGWSRAQPVSVVARKNEAAVVESAPAVKVETRTDSGKQILATVFPVPNGNVGNDLAATHIFAVVGPSRRLFMREGNVHEVDSMADGHARLEPMEPARMASVIETFGARVMALESTGKNQAFQWRAKIMGENHCRMLLHSNGARDFLPPIRQLAAAAVLAPDGDDDAKLLGYGWHAHAGGTFVTSRAAVPVVEFDEALELFADLLDGFSFAADADASRAAASFLSPAMKLGRWIDDDFPLDVAEADQSQAGKSFRHKLIAAIYGETPFQITNSTGGVGSLDERVGAALIAGRPIITLENIRGRMDSQTLESAIRGIGRVTARAFRACVEVDTSPFLWQLSTNGAELTRDLANRAIITRIRKQPDDFQYRQFPAGNILAHVKANQTLYLAAVHAVLRQWAKAGCPRTTTTEHDFRGWVGAMDWIVQNLLGLPPLLHGHRDEQMRTANPKLQWLRDVIYAITTSGFDTALGLTASDLAEAAEEHDIPLPGRSKHSSESIEKSVGKVLSKLFRDVGGETLKVDGRHLTRQITQEWDIANRTHREKKIYVIEQPSLNLS